MILHNTSSIVIKKNGKFLLIKRANPPEKGCWAVPGGHVDKGETPYECAVREAKEEAGKVEITTKKPVFVFVHDIELGHRHKAHVFLGEAVGKLKAGTDAAELSWFALEQMKNIELTHYTKKIFNRLYSKLL